MRATSWGRSFDVQGPGLHTSVVANEIVAEPRKAAQMRLASDPIGPTRDIQPISPKPLHPSRRCAFKEGGEVWLAVANLSADSVVSQENM